MRSAAVKPGQELHEEFYQVSPLILESFPRFRLPLDTFEFREHIAQLVPLTRADQRINKEQRQEILDKSGHGLIFVARKDHSIYARHISKQLDLVLMDSNLKTSEIALIFQQALTDRLEDFLEQPVASVFSTLQTDLLVLTEFLWQDPFRIKEIKQHLWSDHSQARHGVNSTFVGLALYIRLNEGELRRKHLDEVALGLLVHDLGMCKIPPFIREKATLLNREEREKIQEHCWIGAKLLHALGVRADSILKQALEHQERLDGKGYPQKLSGREISVVGQLCAAVDSYCAMITHRPYAEAQSPDSALAALIQSPGYNAKMVRALQGVMLAG
ncbi:HD-GYP domain-containing protein [Desulfonatronum thioautotrophicum]|uniref:HD-GYP domain-containing protein n=1 Tax=Desulfonatronum thioautotrophicum TaxID=617001 RepID=UPI0005EB0F98|nr:HD domain-containing phosphohydrolase [Desulfonatronum thioautotrophicum]